MNLHHFPAKIIVLVLLTLLTANCSKSEKDTPNPGSGTNNPKAETVDPKNANGLTEALVIPNAKVVNQPTLPATSASAVAPVVKNTDQTISYSAGSQIILPVDVSNPTSANIAGVYMQINGSTSYYQVPIPTSTPSGTVAIPINIPDNVANGQFQITYKFYDAGGNVSAPQVITISVTPTENCDRTKVSGGEGLTSTVFRLKDKPGVVKIEYDTYSVPDKIDVYQNGVWLGGTGPKTERTTLRKALSCGVATASQGYIGAAGEFIFTYDPTKGDKVEVVVSGCENGGTAWKYTIACPQDIPVGTFVFDGKTYTFPNIGYLYYPDSQVGGLIFTSQGINYIPEKSTFTGAGNFLGIAFRSANGDGLIMKNGQLATNDVYTFTFGIACKEGDNCSPFYDEGNYKSGSIVIKRTGTDQYEVNIDIVFNDNKIFKGSYKGRIATFK
jgi:hypothetical protein